MMFKLPSLRNVAETDPYFHDGQTQSFSEAVQMIAKHQLGQIHSATETGKIVVFLKAITVIVDTNYVKEPQAAKTSRALPTTKAVRDLYGASMLSLRGTPHVVVCACMKA